MFVTHSTEGNVILKGESALSFIACFIYNFIHSNQSFGPSPVILLPLFSGMQGIAELAKGSWSPYSFFISTLLPILVS